MSTRATYQFKADKKDYSAGATIYIHYDGYPEGAAAYFHAMLIAENQRGGLVTRFIRANELAELTDSHEAHGDTEYRYTVTNQNGGPNATLSAKARVWHKNERDGWRDIWDGSLCGFIAANAGMIEDFTPWQQVVLPYGHKPWLNEKAASRLLTGERGAMRTLQIWDRPDNPSPRWGANWQKQAETVKAIVDAFPALRTDDTDRYVATIGEKMLEPTEA